MDPHSDQQTYDVEAATRLSRLGAALIDGLVSFAPVGAVAVLLPVALLGGKLGALLGVLVVAAVVALGVLITQIVLLAGHGQTIGKKVLGIRMITSDGSTPSIWRVFFLRWLPFAVVAAVVQLVLKVQGSGGLIHLLDVVFIFQPTRRCLHDLFADTHVIKA
ncbi:RDD family protein [Geothrix sp. PMB-07]|uniref:RDD family protein n=1 Tax=Geothrix sp. PMB-07 TaxID=3068640 RepID=UPI0027407D55|nr:RDD family protein [Geothrix sp. PMB-07]WLT30316.1 RDD family protein [Geothrix sp. PMB-07]